MSSHKLDARNLMCPLPVIRAQDRVATLAPGDQLTVYATDPGALNDIPAWCRINGHRVIGQSREGREVMITIEVGAAD